MKKIIYFCGVVCLAIVLIVNILFTAYLDKDEHITIIFNSVIHIAGLIVFGSLIFWGALKLDKYLNKDASKQKLKRYIFIIVLAIYIAFNIIWVINVTPGIGGDQIHVSNFAQTIYRDNPDEFLHNLTYAGIPLSEYIQGYKQQIPLAFIYSIFFRLIGCDQIVSLRALNVIGNIAIVIALYKIIEQLSKKHKVNKVLMLILILTFISLPMLSTFIYGDIPGLALSLFSVYYIMRYTETRKFRFAFISAIFAMLGYMARMNSLIFIIATVMYLGLDLFKDKKNVTKGRIERSIINALVIIAFVVISIIPATLIENYYMNKYGMDKNKTYPKISYFLMAMEESRRANGWYNESIGERALREPNEVQDEYKERIKERIKYFSKNPGYAFKFYADKITSIWAENTYSAVMNNKTKENDPITNSIDCLTFYQKILLILTTLCSLVVLIQNRKDISLEILFLVTIFIGGFAFHILWEAKSRYIIPYIVALIPVAGVQINLDKIKEQFSKFFLKHTKKA